MKKLSTVELLDICDSSIRYSVMDRSLYLLSVLYSTDVNNMAKLSIGERDGRLLKFREWLFGPQLNNMAHCPQCAGLVEWETSTADLQLQQLQPDSSIKIFKLESNGFKIDYRLPNSNDIIAAVSKSGQIADASALLSGCILSVQLNDKEYSEGSLPQNIIDKLIQQMSIEDPQAEIKMLLSCPDCKHHWKVVFDILNYLWLEIENWAKRILKEVAILARAFGWSEKEILNLSTHRRQFYLTMLRS